jgi:hypothetical protein
MFIGSVRSGGPFKPIHWSRFESYDGIFKLMRWRQWELIEINLGAQAVAG